MNALLGKITKVRKLAGRKTTPDGLRRLEVSFKPVCVMPSRLKAPAWLKDEQLKVTHEVADAREVGGVGDSIVLTPGESARWLRPLAVDPPVARGAVPSRIRLTLRWWKKGRPGEYTVRAAGRRRTGRFVRRGGVYTATVAPRELLGPAAAPPADLEVTVKGFDGLTVGCAVLPGAGPGHYRLRTAGGPRDRLESHWYSLDVCATRGGGGICRLVETARDTDHFRRDEELIGGVFDYGGHVDVVELGWRDRLRDVSVSSATGQREAEATRLCLAGPIDEPAGIHTTVDYTLFDDLPLLLLHRRVLRGKAKKKDEKPDDRRPKEPVEKMTRVRLGFRAAYLVEANGRWGSRILSADGDRLAAVRHAQIHAWFWNRWRLTDGWAVMEHPGRRECMLYVTDAASPPVLGAWRGRQVVTLEPRWPAQPLRPQGGAGLALGICAGEVCGAHVGGAWVAARRPAADGGLSCALVGRFRNGPAEPAAEFRAGDAVAPAELRRLVLPGVGSVHVAEARLGGATMNDRFDATAGGVPARRQP